MADVIFFISQDEFSDWLEEHQTEASELWVGFYKKNTKRASLDLAMTPIVGTKVNDECLFNAIPVSALAIMSISRAISAFFRLTVPYAFFQAPLSYAAFT